MKKFIEKKLNVYRSFLIIVFAHFISLVGSSMTRFALGVWAYQTTGQVMDFAGILVAGFLPGIILSPIVGVWIDRKGPAKMIMLGNLIGIASLLMVKLFYVFGNLSVIHTLIASAGLSIVSTIQSPALTSIVPFLVPKDKLSRTNGFLSTATSASDVLGPVLAGILMSFGDLNYILDTDILSYCISIFTLCLLWSKLVIKKDEASENAVEKQSLLGEMKKGMAILFENKPLLNIVLLFTVLNFCLGINQVLGQPYILSMGTSREYGFLSSIFGIGMVLGGIIMSLKEVRSNLVKIVLASNFFIGVFIAMTGMVNQLIGIAFLWIVIGILLPVVNTTTLTLIQINTERQYLGRVFSIARMFAWISLPAAYVLGGFVADYLIKSDFTTFYLFGQGKSGIYGMLLGFTGVLIIVTILFFSQVKSVYKLERNDEYAT